MRKLALEDLLVGQAVTIMHGPVETVMMPPMMLGGEPPPTIDTASPGRVFTIEAVDMAIGMIMLRALDGGEKRQGMQQNGPLMSLFEQHAPDTFMYKFKDVELAAVSPEWLKAYVRNFCSKGADDLRRKTRSTAAGENVIQASEGKLGDSGVAG
jgi:hypothetical protein